MTFLFLVTAGQSSEAEERSPDQAANVGVPSSYYLFGELYQHPEGSEDVFSKWYRYKQEIIREVIPVETGLSGIPTGSVSTHLDSWKGFRNDQPYIAGPGREGAIVVPPTYQDITQVPASLIERRAASLATLDLLQEAIDNAPNNAVIQLQPGYYDLSGVLDAFGSASCEYSFYNGQVGPLCMKYGSHALMSHLGTGDVPAGYGLVILGKKKLVITGAVNENNMPQTVFMGNPMAMHPFMNNSYQYNVGFSIGGGSNQVTITGIEFRDFAFPVRILNHYSIPTATGTMFSSDEAFDGGSHKTMIVQNLFSQPLTAVSIEGRHVLPFVKENMIAMGFVSGIRAAINIISAPGKTMENPRILGNTISGAGLYAGVNVAWGFINNGWIKDNIFSGGFYGVQIMGSSGWTLSGNTFSGTSLSGVLLRSNVYSIATSAGVESFLQRSSGNEISANLFQNTPGTAISLWGATLSSIRNNTFQGGGVGIFMFVDINFIILDGLSMDLYYVPTDFNLVESNTITNFTTPVILANYARNNELTGNNITTQGYSPGYMIMGQLITGESVNLGRASGNYILDPNLATNPFLVADLSFCNIWNGITFCEQIDYDNDGLVNEDEINGLNDDEDFNYGITGMKQYLFDEDASDMPNIYVASGNKDMIADGVPVGETSDLVPELYCHPNPVESKSTVKVTLKEDTYMNLNLYNEKGQEVLNLEEQFRSAGTYQYEIVRRDLSPGMYILKLTTNTDVLTQKVILGR